jgi:hypothetical protein
MFAAGITRAFDEVQTRDRRKAPQLFHRESQRSIDKTMKQQLMLSRVNRGDTRVMPLEMQR